MERSGLTGERGSFPHPTRERLGPYRLCLKLAAGGMATVYLARADANIGRNHFVALKVIHPHLANNSEFVQMFLDEADIASRLHHANVCTVFDSGEQRGSYYIAMEYLVGRSLASLWRRIERRPQADAQRHAKLVARALAGACEGLHAAHELTDPSGEPLDIVHRDVSPENIYLTYDGVTKVMDFGIAAAAQKRHRTRTGIVKGKFAYVAPEYLDGQQIPDRRADVWGVGVVAWELLTGKRLFHRDTDFDTLRAVHEASIPPPSEVRRGLPPELDAVVLRALRSDRDERYLTARDLGKALAKFASAGEESVGEAELAEWMAELFPGGAQQSLQLLDFADRVDEVAEVDAPPVAADCACAASAASGPPGRPASQSPPAAGTQSAASPRPEGSVEWMMPTTLWPPRSSAPPPPSATPQSRSRWMGLGALAVGLLVGGGVVALVLASHDSARASSEPARAEAELGAASTRAASSEGATRVVDRGGTPTQIVRGDFTIEVDQRTPGEVVLTLRANSPAASRGDADEAAAAPPVAAGRGGPAARRPAGQARGRSTVTSGYAPEGI